MKWFSPHPEPRPVAVSIGNAPTPHQLEALCQRCFSPWESINQNNTVSEKKYPDLDLGQGLLCSRPDLVFISQ